MANTTGVNKKLAYFSAALDTTRQIPVNFINRASKATIAAQPDAIDGNGDAITVPARYAIELEMAAEYGKPHEQILFATSGARDTSYTNLLALFYADAVAVA